MANHTTIRRNKRFVANVNNKLGEYGISKTGPSTHPYRVIVESQYVGCYETLKEAVGQRDDWIEFILEQESE